MLVLLLGGRDGLEPGKASKFFLPFRQLRSSALFASPWDLSGWYTVSSALNDEQWKYMGRIRGRSLPSKSERSIA
jgi:hypothetical protein